MALAFPVITQKTSALSQLVMIFAISTKRWNGWIKPSAIALTYLVNLPGDAMLGSGLCFMQFSYIANHFVIVERKIAVGTFQRHFGLILITSLFAIDTIALVIRNIRQDCWRGRWRVRNDAPILPHVGLLVEPRAPQAWTAS